MATEVTIVQPKSDMYLELPKSIRIGAFDYRTEEISVIDSHNFAVAGDFNHHYLRIRVLEGHRPQRRAEILLHEVLHGVYESMGISGEDGEEDTVRKMAIGLIQVIRDNPEMMDFIKKSVEQGTP